MQESYRIAIYLVFFITWYVYLWIITLDQTRKTWSIIYFHVLYRRNIYYIWIRKLLLITLLKYSPQLRMKLDIQHHKIDLSCNIRILLLIIRIKSITKLNCNLFVSITHGLFIHLELRKELLILPIKRSYINSNKIE
jgi:hypothetical protein